MSGRLERALKDRQILAQLLAVLIMVVGAINVIPAAYHWNLWADQTAVKFIPAWIYIQLVIASLLMLYAVFLWQIRHWSSLKVVATLALVFAGMYAFVATSLVTGGTSSQLAGVLGISYSISKTALVWCIAMLLISLVVSILAIKEALNWQRIEQLIIEISGPSNSG